MYWNVYFSLSTDLLFPELPEDPMHDLPREVYDPELRKASGRGTFDWWLSYNDEKLGFYAFLDKVTPFTFKQIRYGL